MLSAGNGLESMLAGLLSGKVGESGVACSWESVPKVGVVSMREQVKCVQLNPPSGLPCFLLPVRDAVCDRKRCK